MLSLYTYIDRQSSVQKSTLYPGALGFFLKDVPPKAEGGVGREGRPKDRVITKPLQ